MKPRKKKQPKIKSTRPVAAQPDATPKTTDKEPEDLVEKHFPDAPSKVQDFINLINAAAEAFEQNEELKLELILLREEVAILRPLAAKYRDMVDLMGLVEEDSPKEMAAGEQDPAG